MLTSKQLKQKIDILMQLYKVNKTPEIKVRVCHLILKLQLALENNR